MAAVGAGAWAGVPQATADILGADAASEATSAVAAFAKIHKLGRDNALAVI